MIKERRKFIRLDSRIDFDYKTRDSGAPRDKSVTKNISPGGIRALVDKNIRKGDWLELDIHIPNLEKPVSCVGKVIWTTEEKTGKIDVGIKFEEIEPEMKNKFLEYICELMFSELQRSAA